MNFFYDQYLLDAIAQGQFTFGYGISPWLFLLLVVGLVTLVWALYRKTTRTLPAAWKVLLISLRSAVLVILLFCLLRPVVSVQQVVPQETYLAVLIDDSQSMSIRDLAGSQSRDEAVKELLYGDADLIATLGDSFQVRTFRFDKRTQRVKESGELESAGTASSIDQALQYVDTQLSGLALGGILLISDGAGRAHV